MVKGLDRFRAHFAGLEGQYVLIGGTAATLAMAQAGLDFRATNDLDIVLHIEALTPAFGTALWAFVEAGVMRSARPAPPESRFSTDSRNQHLLYILRCWSCSAECLRRFILPRALT